MTQVGIVEENKGKYITVRIARASACGENCASCKGGCVPTEITAEAINNAGAREGDHVILEMDNTKIFSAELLVYIFPVIMLILGYIAGVRILENEDIAIFVSIVCGALSIIPAVVADRKLGRNYELIAVSVL